MLRYFVLVALVSLSSTAAAYAEFNPSQQPLNAAVVREIARAVWAQPWNVDDSPSRRPLKIDPLTIPALAQGLDSRRSAAAQTPERRRRSWGRKLAGGAIGAVGGFFGGGYLGAALEPDCNCDDPGFTGFLIGAPIGAVVGGILGATLLF